MAGGAAVDPSVSRSAGSGALRFDGPAASAASQPVPVREGVQYTAAAYIRTRPWPVQIYITVEFLDRKGNHTGTAQGSAQLTSAPDRWEEAVVSFTPGPADAFARVLLGRYPARPRLGTSFSNGIAWVDDVYFGEGLGFEQPPSEKVPFSGSAVHVDRAGNFDVLRAGRFVPFFPLCIYGVGDRLSLYSAQGFNCIARAPLSSAFLTAARGARSALNPDGLLATLEVTPYFTPGSPAYADTTGLRRAVDALTHSTASNDVLAYYWDDEQYDAYDVPKEVTDALKSADRDATGMRIHPIYVVEGNQGRARAMGRLADVVGDYLRPEKMRGARQQPTGTRLTILRSIEGQTAPPSIFVISEAYGAESLRRLVYEGLIAGVRGLAYYRDGACFVDYDGDPKGPGCKDVTQRPSWAVVPELRKEIDQLLPILREPVGTSWQASTADSAIVVGTRNHDCDGYVFVLNDRSAPASTSIDVRQLPYAATRATDVLTGKSVAVRDGRFTLALGSVQMAVVRLER